MRSIDVVMLPGVTECAGQHPLGLVREYEVEIAHLQALRAQALNRYAYRHPSAFLAEDLAIELGWSPQTAHRHLTEGREPCRKLPATVAALRRGEIDWQKAMRLSYAVRALSVEQSGQVESWVLERAAGKTVEQLTACARRRVIAVDPHGAAARAETSRARRRAWLQPLEDGVAELGAELPAEAATAAYTRIEALARRARTSGDGRTMEQLRADVLTDLLLGTRQHGQGGPAVRVNVTIDAATLAGLAEKPARLHGYGPLDAATARRLATDAIWRRIITDPATGTILDVGHRRYRPPAAMREQVVLRNRQCRFPGCRRTAEHTDLDHTRASATGGRTSEANLAALCRRHHRMKQHVPSEWVLRYGA